MNPEILDLCKAKSIPTADLLAEPSRQYQPDYSLSIDHFASSNYFPSFYRQSVIPSTPLFYYPLSVRESVTLPDIQPSLDSECIRIGCFYRPMKCDLSHFSDLSRILQLIPNSKLYFAGLQSSQLSESYLRLLFHSLFSISPDRIFFVPKSPMDYIFAFMNSLDCMIAPGPEAGAISFCDSLMMGLPPILIGNKHSSPLPQTILRELGLDRYHVNDPASAVSLIHTDPLSKSLRIHIRSLFLNSRFASTTNLSNFCSSFISNVLG